MLSIGERIRNRRKELKLSVDQLAEMLGKNRATVYRYESDDIENMPLTVLEPLAKALKVKPSYLMGWDESENEFESIASHHEGDDWTEEELEELERFKEFVRAKRRERSE